MQLYSYFRSSAAYRVRIALNLKQLAYDYVPVNLLRNGGEQHSVSYQQLNPAQLIPTLVDESLVLSQSLAIIEYLDERYPEPALLPKEISLRAQVRAFAQSIACDIHPLNNLRVLRYLEREFSVGQSAKDNWYRHWILQGFQALEQQLTRYNHQFCFGEQPSMADCCLIPQVYNALRFECDMSKFPHISRIYQHCMETEAFFKAAPEQQPDAV